MKYADEENVEWLAPWNAVDHARRDALERELHRELMAGHELFGHTARAVARRQDNDDVLFALDDGSGRVAVVHLTWTQSPPERPPWPDVVLYPSLQSWASEGMRADHEEFEA